MKSSLITTIIFLLITSLVFAETRVTELPIDTTQSQADSILRLIHSEAMRERDSGRFEKAEELYREVVRLKETYSRIDSFRLANVYANYSILLSDVWKNDDAMAYLDKAIEMSDPTDPDNLRVLLMNKGGLLLESNDFKESLDYYNQVERNILKDSIINHKLLLDIYISKYDLFLKSNDLDESYKYLKKIITSPYLDRHRLIDLKIKEFELLTLNMQYDKAIALYISMMNQSLAKNNQIELILNKCILLYNHLNKTDEAINIYLELLKNSADNKDFSKVALLSTYNNLANCYDKKKMFREALDYYQKALMVIYPYFKDIDLNSDPKPLTIYEESQNLPVFKNKAEVMYKYSRINGDTLSMSTSLEDCLRCINIIQKMRFRITSNQSQYVISKKERFVFNLSQLAAIRKYEETKDKYYLNLAFRVNEEGRAFTLVSAMRNQKAMDFGNIPDKIRKQESELNRQLSLYDELLYKERQKDQPDSVKMSNWEDQLFITNEQYNKLLNKIEREYPEYYRLRFDDNVSDMYSIMKKIDKETTLLEYSFLDSFLIIYSTSRKDMSVTLVKTAPGFEDKCLDFLNLLTTQNFSNSATATYNRYTSLAQELYSTLIEPVRDKIDGGNLIIIPDGAISYIPFDALLTSKVPQGRPDYRNLPYLLKDFSVGYSYSSTLHFNPPRHIRIPSESILAFAPLYASALDEYTDPNPVRDEKYLDLRMLPGVAIEVNNISKIHKTDAFYNMDARESKFKEMAGRYRILHLAMHTMVDNNDPMLSKLIFTQIPDRGEDGLLHTYEIYNMKLNASMTVLSSCSSGYGKIQPGEGVQSLARGFAYAGCPSILMTLWEVGDLSTVLVMTDFYEFLSRHKTKPQALRESKLNFLAEADELRANPFFWASYVVIGDSSPIYPASANTYMLNVFLLALPMGFVGAFYRKYKKEEKKNHRRAA
jgi:CHAT domain-containing protein